MKGLWVMNMEESVFFWGGLFLYFNLIFGYFFYMFYNICSVLCMFMGCFFLF